MELINNEAVDFVFAVKRFADRNKPLESEYPGVPQIAQWCIEIEGKLSPFLLNDISLMVEKTVLTSVYLFLMIQSHKNIQSAKDFLLFLEKTKAEEFHDYVTSSLTEDESTEITREHIYKTLVDDGLHPGYDLREESELLYGFLKQPGDFLKRLHRTYIDFYEQAFLPGKLKLQTLADEKLKWHQERLENGSIEYLRQLGLYSFIKENFSDAKPNLYFSFFADNETSAFWKSRTLVIGGGTDQRILHHSARSKADIFFACFGDPKRLEILRLTAQRPWYSTELANHFDVKPATLSYHMNKLVEAELLHIAKGKSRRFYYTLNREVLEDYLGFVSQDLLGIAPTTNN